MSRNLWQSKHFESTGEIREECERKCHNLGPANNSIRDLHSYKMDKIFMDTISLAVCQT
jgi:hypothetical protein